MVPPNPALAEELPSASVPPAEALNVTVFPLERAASNSAVPWGPIMRAPRRPLPIALL